METRRIGELEVSVVGLGCNNLGSRLDLAGTSAVVDACFDAGITLFDTADIYGGDGASEELLGRALGSRRDEVVIATKFGMRLDDERTGAHPDYIPRACEASLRRLGTDHLDLYQLHTPDPDVPIEETLGALDDLIRAGKVRELGHSNLSAEQADEAEATAQRLGTARFVAAQDHWSLLARDVEDDILQAVARHDLKVLPFFPLASGLLTGKYTAEVEQDPTWRLNQRAAPRAPGPLDHRGAPGHHPRAGGLRPRRRPQPAGAGDVVAGHPGAGRLRHRGRLPPRAGPCQRRGRRLAAQRRGAGRGGPDHRTMSRGGRVRTVVPARPRSRATSP